MKNFEDVNGYIVGGYSCKVYLIDPKNNVVDHTTTYRETDFNKFGKDMKEKALSCKVFKDRPDLINTIHGEGEWTLKIVDIT